MIPRYLFLRYCRHVKLNVNLTCALLIIATWRHGNGGGVPRLLNLATRWRRALRPKPLTPRERAAGWAPWKPLSSPGTEPRLVNQLCSCGYYAYRSLLWACMCYSVYWLGYVLDNWVIVVQFPAGTRHLSLLRNVQTGSGAHPAYYSMGFGPDGKAAGAWSLSLISIQCRDKEWVELFRHSVLNIVPFCHTCWRISCTRRKSSELPEDGKQLRPKHVVAKTDIQKQVGVKYYVHSVSTKF